MAKLTARQKINIKAKWDTGQYTKEQLSKSYKVSDVMIGKIVGKEKPMSADIVEAGLLVEKAKKFGKSSAESSAIDNAIKYRLDKEFSDDKKRIKIYDLSNKLLDKVESILDKGTKQIAIKVKDYSKDGGSNESLQVVDIDLDTTDVKNLSETVDKQSVTQNVNARHAPKQDINLQQQQTQLQNPKVTIVRRSDRD